MVTGQHAIGLEGKSVLGEKLVLLALIIYSNERILKLFQMF